MAQWSSSLFPPKDVERARSKVQFVPLKHLAPPRQKRNFIWQVLWQDMPAGRLSPIWLPGEDQLGHSARRYQIAIDWLLDKGPRRSPSLDFPDRLPLTLMKTAIRDALLNRTDYSQMNPQEFHREILKTRRQEMHQPERERRTARKRVRFQEADLTRNQKFDFGYHPGKIVEFFLDGREAGSFQATYQYGNNVHGGLAPGRRHPHYIADRRLVSVFNRLRAHPICVYLPLLKYKSFIRYFFRNYEGKASISLVEMMEIAEFARNQQLMRIRSKRAPTASLSQTLQSSPFQP